VRVGLAQVDRQVRHRRHGRDFEVHLDHPATVIAGVIDHVQQHRAGRHGAAFAGNESEPQGFVQRGIGLPCAPVAVPAIHVLLRQAQHRQFRVHQVMGGLEAVPSAFEVSLPDTVHHIDVIERADHVLEDAGAFFFDFTWRQ